MKKIGKTVLIALLAVTFLSACTAQKTDEDYKGMVNTAVKAEKKWHEKNELPDSPYYKPDTAKVYQDGQDKDVYYVRFDNGETSVSFWKIKDDKAHYLYDPNGDEDEQDEQASKIMDMEQVYHTKQID
ncbi:hypothetical protein GNF18_06585 [Ligilactobacillus pobuzihii]|uniref:hypothetical protein n=1 Tax=Ligilactobacillus pobuzihii TaxID=449659 RepID=UPI0019CFDC13|nr:hypothetical protein [Ligilactobacillus pobuzihii]MBN7274798.1 hypothetical protein [Ligilactobacillus pobuzihii]